MNEIHGLLFCFYHFFFASRSKFGTGLRQMNFFIDFYSIPFLPSGKCSVASFGESRNIHLANIETLFGESRK